MVETAAMQEGEGVVVDEALMEPEALAASEEDAAGE